MNIVDVTENGRLETDCVADAKTSFPRTTVVVIVLT